MCGIAGQYCLDGKAPDSDLLAAMAERLAHRGPDGQGMKICDSTGLVHRRLAIIDLTDEGLQPMSNEDGTLWLVFNGEIYNFVELREELLQKGHHFHSHSDTEVILHAYEEWGEGCLSRFNGMWAFALWDGNRKQLFCARDRLGIKPFYYTQAGGSFLFASEIKALLSHPDAGRKPDDLMLGTFLAWGVLDHSARTMFDGISQILPAHYLVVDADGPKQPVRYWDVKVSPAVHSQAAETGAVSRLLDLLHDATRIHLRSDVAVGTCLSGGIDSSTLTALINDIIRKDAPASVGSRQKTFSAVFTDRRFDESRYIDEIVQATGVDAHRVEPSAGQLWDDIDHLVWVQDEPFGSLSIYAQYCVMRLAQKNVKVVLDGQGADELLAGYIAYQGTYLATLLRSFRWLTAVQELAGSMSRHRGFFRSALGQLRERKARRGLLTCKAESILRYNGSLDHVLHRELTATNLPSLLHYEDRNSMAFSIESRVPFLDYRFVEYVAALPLNQKIRHGITKTCLRHAIKGIVPESIRCRMDKMGFVTPEEVWMKEDLRPFILQVLSQDTFRMRPYWDAGAVIRDYLAFLEGKSPYSPEIWRIVNTELWLQKFFDQRPALATNSRIRSQERMPGFSLVQKESESYK
ncbi:asparagine synthase (glutamine-hydrolyzing) [Methanoregula formicica]|uniref:Putative asparagine synthetase [glutamine-hydrolyzing] n=1 Tax=Methanoregula formicica (strain DSM 22288 / NBRC 105244 / SMSP) TaxID=593750 RepID=L0HDX1_METFS|nr:asparagine synthase (glutamine-hydrolyzing) [Methanoregula formicica]AGB01284.1 asparagine synthase, glutamine-hydrolyzing [Methanoregula formicica SMSP]